MELLLSFWAAARPAGAWRVGSAPVCAVALAGRDATPLSHIDTTLRHHCTTRTTALGEGQSWWNVEVYHRRMNHPLVEVDELSNFCHHEKDEIDDPIDQALPIELL